MTKKCLFLCVDGVRSDSILYANCENFRSLLSHSNTNYSMHCQTIKTTVSTPSWTSILTGKDETDFISRTNEEMTADHQVKFLKENLFINKLSKSTKVIVSSWDEFANSLQKSMEGQGLPSTSTSLFEGSNVANNDHRTSQELIKTLDNEFCVDFIMTYLMNVDETGHNYGFNINSKEYIAALEVFDYNLGIIINKIRKRESLFNEEWSIVITSDHGGCYLKDLNEEERVEYFKIFPEIKAGIHGLPYPVFTNTIFLNNHYKNGNREIVNMHTKMIANNVLNFFD